MGGNGKEVEFDFKQKNISNGKRRVKKVGVFCGGCGLFFTGI